MLALKRSYTFSAVLFIFLLLLYTLFGYSLQREELTYLLLFWVLLFATSTGFFFLNRKSMAVLFVAGMVFRAIFLIAIPNLSQDFYRFIWDGRMLLEGFNPYLSLPETWIARGDAPIPQATELYKGMGELNGSHYTNYPPVSQLLYGLSALFASKSIINAAIVLRICILLADIGIFYVGRKLLAALKLPQKRIFWYFLNPFIIIELTGNLHFEAIMIFFIIWSLYLLQKGYWYWAAVIIGISVSVKLIPLLFLPLFFKSFITSQNFTFNRTSEKTSVSTLKRWQQLSCFYLLAAGTVFLTFLPFFSVDFFSNFIQTVSLWFQKFEFNASIYYIIRWIGYQTVGWNIIETAGKILPLVTLLILLGITFFRKNDSLPQLITAMLLGISSYYFLSTTIHPWYIAVPLALCIFTRYKFPIVWSFVIVLSYTAYVNSGFKENLWMVGLEYVIVFGVFFYEIYKQSALSNRLSS